MSAQRARLLMFVTCNLKSTSHHIAFTSTIGAGVSAETSGSLSINTPLRWHELSRLYCVRSELLLVNDVHHSVALELDLEVFVKQIQRLCSLDFHHYAMCFDGCGIIQVTPRHNMTSIGMGLRTKPDLLSEVLEMGQLSLRDVQSLAASSKTLHSCLAREAKHRLRTALAPYFPQTISGLAGVLKDHDALISGSTILHILVPGDWSPGDLDIILPGSAGRSFEAFLSLNGYALDPEREHLLLRNYPPPISAARTSFRYRCFINDILKIDLCYIGETSPPITHILTYHSTAVMNYYDGTDVYCLFPEETFSSEYLVNSRALSKGARQDAALEKLRLRDLLPSRVILLIGILRLFPPMETPF